MPRSPITTVLLERIGAIRRQRDELTKQLEALEALKADVEARSRRAKRGRIIQSQSRPEAAPTVDAAP